MDDVQVFSLAFNRTEMVELSKLIALADVKLQQGRVGECLHLLEGYWPRFLAENVPLTGSIAANNSMAAKPKPPTPEEKPPTRSGWLHRMKDLLPESLKF